MASAELPNLDHIQYDNANVYQPAEDTFLFCDVLKSQLEFLGSIELSVVVEIGPGSGAVFTYLASILKQKAFYIGLDINETAVNISKQTAMRNHILNFDLVRMDLTTQFRLDGLVDLLLFNPPYVPTPSSEVGSHGIEAAWAGGKHGREVIDRVLPIVKKLLSKNGVFYMVVVKENKLKNIERVMLTEGFCMEIVKTRKAYNEILSILKFSRMVK